MRLSAAGSRLRMSALRLRPRPDLNMSGHDQPYTHCDHHTDLNILSWTDSASSMDLSAESRSPPSLSMAAM